MRIRIRGPSGQSTITLDDATSTVENLRKAIEKETSLVAFEVKYSYPPKPLPLDQYSSSTLLSSLDIKLSGEQLLVARVEPRSAIKPPSSHASNSTPSEGAGEKASSSKPTPTKSSSSTPNQRSTPKAPLSLTRAPNSASTDPPIIALPSISSTLTLRVTPDDNSCLFRALSASLLPHIDAVVELRSIVASTIHGNPKTYTPAILDNKSPAEYAKWIQYMDSWGGQVELAVLAEYFGVEVIAVDVQFGRVDRYNSEEGQAGAGEEKNEDDGNEKEEGRESKRLRKTPAKSCAIVMYSGIHYDAVVVNLGGREGEPDSEVLMFEPAIKEEVLKGAVELAGRLRERGYYTDTAGFRIRCEDCGVIVVGEKGATKHSRETGHYRFGEAA
jgi:ubiquitin thioesterase OTU1